MTASEMHWAWFGPYLILTLGFVLGSVYEYLKKKQLTPKTRVWILQHRTNGQVHGVWSYSPSGDELWAQMLVRTNNDYPAAQELDASSKVFSQEVL